MTKEKNIYTLSKVTQAIENVISKYASKYIWIKAEIVKLNYYAQSGHCYPDLVEKKDNKIIAELRGNIWSSNFEKINKKFKTVLNESIGDNMTVVFYASVKFHSVYGLSLNIIDVDPSYTLGELAKQKAETIQKLKAENIFNLNKQTKLPLVPKIIAIISVSTSKGYNDFINVINNNSWKYKFQYLLFPAILQGDRAVETIINQLNRIAKYKNVFDAVAIIRGGGGEVGLSCYDDYKLASTIAKYPIPVLTGIGHSTNETVTELVSFKSFITPTKIGEFLLQQYHNFSVPLEDNTVFINNFFRSIVNKEKSNLKGVSRLFSSLTHRIFDSQKILLKQSIKIILSSSINLFQTEKRTLKSNANIIQYSTSRFIQTQNYLLKQIISNIKNLNEKLMIDERHKLKEFSDNVNIKSLSVLDITKKNIGFIQNKISILDPSNILKRGFSITKINGKLLQDTTGVNKGDMIETILYEGLIESRIENIKK
jgi:exodeoxyribonuclease VII large subunit